MKKRGGTVTVDWEAASAYMHLSQVDLIVNGVVKESRKVKRDHAKGSWDVRINKSSWLALLVRGYFPYNDRNREIIGAHSSPVMVDVTGSEFFAAADALTILDQIEGALAYLDTVGTRAENAAYKRMRMVLTGAHRRLHNRLHASGVFHEHTPATDHKEHHG